MAQPFSALATPPQRFKVRRHLAQPADGFMLGAIDVFQRSSRTRCLSQSFGHTNEKGRKKITRLRRSLVGNQKVNRTNYSIVLYLYLYIHIYY